MGIEFEFHRFNEARYQQLLPVLRALARGRMDPAWPDVLRACLAVTETEDFRLLNAGLQRDQDWPPLLRRCLDAASTGVLPRLSKTEREGLPDVLIGLYCMPRFQSFYISGPESDTLVSVRAGGLIIHLNSEKAPWFERWFTGLGIHDAEHRYAEFPFGMAMIILRRDQVRALHQDLVGMAAALPEDENPYLIPTYRRLVTLVSDVLASDDTLAWVET